MSQYFPKRYEPFDGDINVKVDLSNYVTKSDIQNITHVDTSGFPLKTNLASLKIEFDKLDIHTLVSACSCRFKKAKCCCKNDIVKKTEYDILVAKASSIDTSAFVLKTKYDTNKSEL